jgi:hypothetical protein
MPPAVERTKSLRPVGVVLHVGDHSLAQRQDLRPFVPPTGLLSPREHNRDAPVALLEPINSEVVIAVPVSPLDL